MIEEIAAMDLDIEVYVEDLQNINSEEILLCMLEPYFLQALRSGYFTIKDMNDIFVRFCKFYTNSEAAYRQPSTNAAETAQWVKATAKREMVVFINSFMEQTYLDQEIPMDFVSDCVEDWGPKVLQIFRPECREAHEEGRITEDDFTSLSLDELTTAINENRYPRDSSYGHGM